jgi:hypothetical protein
LSTTASMPVRSNGIKSVCARSRQWSGVGPFTGF